MASYTAQNVLSWLEENSMSETWHAFLKTCPIQHPMCVHEYVSVAYLMLLYSWQWIFSKVRGISLPHKADRVPGVSWYFPSHRAFSHDQAVKSTALQNVLLREERRTMKRAYNDLWVYEGEQEKERKVSRGGGGVMGGRHLQFIF